MFEVKHEATFYGANPYSSHPTLVVRILPGSEAIRSLEALTQGCRRLHQLFPDWLDTPISSPKDPIAQIGEIAARWALAAMNEVRGFLHDAGAVAIPGGARIWIGFHHQNISFSALKLALEVLTHASLSAEFDRKRLDSALASLWQLCRTHHPDYQARILMQGARARGVPVLPFIPDSKYWQYGWGSRSRVFVETTSNADGFLGTELQRSKVLSKIVCSELGLRTPKYKLVNDVTGLSKAAEEVGWPCVVKPISLGGGKGVTAGIESLIELEAAFALAKRYTKEPVMIEAFVPGDDHRLMVLNGRFFAGLRREPSSIIGDGESTVAQLIAMVNRARSPNLIRSRYLRPIETDDVLNQQLARQGVSSSTVLECGKKIWLRSNSNLSTGGVCIDVTIHLHPHFRDMAENLSRTIGLPNVGIDYITTDVGRSWHDHGELIEINSCPSADVAIAAGVDPLAVAFAVLGTTPSRIPIHLLVIPELYLPTAAAFMRAELTERGDGWACNGQAAIGGMLLCVKRPGTWSAVATLLRQQPLEYACVALTPGELMRDGMPVDRVDVVAYCNTADPPLPAEWIKVLSDYSGTFIEFSDWADLISWLQHQPATVSKRAASPSDRAGQE
jgi:cyanophycin synthetase